MKHKFFILTLVFLSTLFANSCKNNKTETIIENKEIIAEITNDGYFECFEDSLMKKNGKPYTCEPSTVVFCNNNLFIANDKPFPHDFSSFFSFNFSDTTNLNDYTNYTDSLFFLVNKYEASSVTPDAQFMLFSSSYSYPASDPKNGDTYNTTIFVNPNDFSNSGVLHFKGNSGISSKDVKRGIKNALKCDSFPNGPDYLKLEGLAILPNNKIIFGIREFGNAYNDFQYTITFLQADYIQTNTSFVLTSDIIKIYEFTPSDTLGLELPLGLSSVEYNVFDSTIYFVSSHEIGTSTDSICSYIWHLSLNDLNNNLPAKIIKGTDNKPLKLVHKIEGLTILNKNSLILIADDDRITGINENAPSFTRKLNQSYWCKIKIIR